MSPAEIKAECERIWKRPGVGHPFHKNKAVFGECYEDGVPMTHSRKCVVLIRGAKAPAFDMIERNKAARLKRLVERNQRLK